MSLKTNDLEELSQKVQAVVAEVEKVIVGKRSTIELALLGLLSGGHVLVQDIPGVGKTTLAKALAKALGCSFKRIQFTPDLLPSDITGISIYNQKTGEFQFRPGPVFANVILADEINRTSPRTQSSLLECMEEFQVTVDGVTYPLPQPCFIIATENPIEHRGTYPLPESQLDRFLMRLRLGYPTREQEVTILTQRERQQPLEEVRPVLSQAEVLRLQKLVREVTLTESLKAYIVALVDTTRTHPYALLGASPRGSLGLMYTSQAWAAMHGRSYVIPDDVKFMAPHVLTHRLVMRPEATARGVTPQKVVEDALNSVPVPMSR